MTKLRITRRAFLTGASYVAMTGAAVAAGWLPLGRLTGSNPDSALLLQGDQSGDLLLQGDYSGSLLLEGTY